MKNNTYGGGHNKRCSVLCCLAAMLNFIYALLPSTLIAEDKAEEMSVKIGQRHEPIVEQFQSIRSRFERENPGGFYQGFVATVNDRSMNNGVPLGATFGSPLVISLQNEQYSLTFPAANLASFSFNEAGELDNFLLNPQRAFSAAAETQEIIEKVNELFRKAGWRTVENAAGRWRAKWLKADVYVKRTHCGDGGAEEECELVQVSVTRAPQLTAVVTSCGEIEETAIIGKEKAPGSHTGSVRVINEQAKPKFKPGCPRVRAKLGTQFGMQVVVSSADKDSSIVWDLVTRVHHPQFSGGQTVDEWNSPMNLGVERYTGWVFEEKSELVPGQWVFELALGTETLVRQVFEIKLTTDAP